MLTQLSQVVQNFDSLQTNRIDTKRGYRLLVVGHAFDSVSAAITADANTARSVRTTSELAAAFPTADPADPDSVLPFAISRALPTPASGVSTSDLPEVVFVLAESAADADYITALQSVAADDRYTWVVSLSQSAAVLDEIQSIKGLREGLGLATVPLVSAAAPTSSTPTAEIAAYVTAAEDFDDGSIVVWPHTVLWDGQSVDIPLFLAAVGGVLSQAAVHQPLKFVAIDSRWSSPFTVGPYVTALFALKGTSPGLFTLVTEAQQLRISTPQTNDVAADQDLWVTVVGTRQQVRREIIRALQSVNVPSNSDDAFRVVRDAVRDVLDDIQDGTRRSDLLSPSFSSYESTVTMPTTAGECIDIQVELVVPISLITDVCVTVNAQVS